MKIEAGINGMFVIPREWGKMQQHLTTCPREEVKLYPDVMIYLHVGIDKV